MLKNKTILELEKENKRLAVKNKELEKKLEKANSIVMAYTNELQTRESYKRRLGYAIATDIFSNLIRSTVNNGTVISISPIASQSISFRQHWT